ncbi:Methylmalonyl-CoA epimerase [Trinorchestia longiramus]|nr:Methylmalonyl-CoA epimerase [Trinorchestia longiramus]
MLEIVNGYSRDFKVKFGGDKSKVMVINADETDRDKEWNIGEVTIGRTKEYNSLRCMLSRDGCARAKREKVAKAMQWKVGKFDDLVEEFEKGRLDCVGVVETQMQNRVRLVCKENKYQIIGKGCVKGQKKVIQTMLMMKTIASECNKHFMRGIYRHGTYLALSPANGASCCCYFGSFGVQNFRMSSARQSSGGISESIWQLGRLNHIAIAVPDLAAASAFYRDVLRARVSPPEDLPSHGVTTVFVELDNTKLELLHPLGDKSPIAKYLERNKAGGLHHVCLEVPDITAAVTSVSASGVRCLSKEPTIGAHGKPVMFLHPADCHGVLVELEQA